LNIPLEKLPVPTQRGSRKRGRKNTGRALDTSGEKGGENAAALGSNRWCRAGSVWKKEKREWKKVDVSKRGPKKKEFTVMIPEKWNVEHGQDAG